MSYLITPEGYEPLLDLKQKNYWYELVDIKIIKTSLNYYITPAQPPNTDKDLHQSVLKTSRTSPQLFSFRHFAVVFLIQ